MPPETAARALARHPFHVIFAGRYGPLLTSLLLLLIGGPFLSRSRGLDGTIDALVCAVVLMGLYAADPRRRSLAVGGVLAASTLATHALTHLSAAPVVYGVHYALTIALLAYATGTILVAIVLDPLVTPETIKGAVCVYLLMGLTWAFLFAAVDLLFPRSFQILIASEGQQVGHLLVRESFSQLIYFSYSTLTTLGYGDIIPLRRASQTFAYLEAVAGQIYLTVLVARLVGMHIARPPDGDRPAP